ncbi:hypothetical protein [Klebsiella pneumoniae]|uniref:hypothetical protein n=1 Tax=Klebsiella pneumoniae TaxID=573 RepID=UPI000B4106B6|nr:hypothetical protein [Klebsiella pneumoniae]OVV60206.1 hypothetical protein BME68_14460 [Klebsiella pneumoniae]OVV63646.1 hypothetical protein BME67_15040 [Klebsiella pneumoniae]OVV67485.1 hypothetical protein BME66_15460 [Klebsiella pneumoniae]OVV81101.1 hypothetical protein BME64_15710 [Klebsiella pneumoniae]
MNIETVNELIATLESAGELSIKEQKVLKLAKAYQHVAAENVRLAAENKMAVDAVTVFSNVTHDVTENICDELGHDRVAEIVAAYNDLGNMPATDRIVAGIKADGVESGIKTIMTMLNHQAPGVSDAINVLRVHSSELREGADK